MKTLFCVSVALAVPLLAVAPARADDAKALQGVWKPFKAEAGGQALPDAVVKTITLKLDKGRYEVTFTGDPKVDQGTTTLDTKSKPKGITIKGVKGPNAGKTIPAIYELKGDTLRVCYDLSGAKRPTAFKTTAGTQLALMTYKRAKK
jgi:uncharacterized protein (TIGR03067 family)